MRYVPPLRGIAGVTLLLLAVTGAGMGAPAQVPGPAPATNGLTIAPVQLSLSGMARSVSTMVHNPGSYPITVQTRLYGWTMRGEDEVYGPAADAGFSPPLFRLEPHATQAVRIVAKAPPGPVERSYRLIVDQLPIADTPGQLQMPVRMVLPVFVEAAGVPRVPVLEWSARYDPQGGRGSISVRNRGAVHARITDLAVEDGTRTIAVAPGLAGYALAGQARDWSYKAADLPRSLTITARDGAKPVRVTVPVTR